MFTKPPRCTRPGLFITATDTGVGKTAVACAIAWSWRVQAPPARRRVSACKPVATGCRRDREGLVSEDAEALAHFADCRQPLDVICPVRYTQPVAPAVAAEMSGRAMDFDALARSLELLDAAGDALLIEGVGGLLVPLGITREARAPGLRPYVAVLDLAAALGYPVVVVARAGLGTLNHTAMTVELLRQRGCRVAGIVINGYEADAAGAEAKAPWDGKGGGKPGAQGAGVDASMATNRAWLERMNRVPILATVPACPPAEVAPQRGQLPPAILDAVGLTYWPDVAMPPLPRC